MPLSRLESRSSEDSRRRFFDFPENGDRVDPKVCPVNNLIASPSATYYEGETLKQRIERGPLPVDEALEIAAQVAQGLVEAHKAGIIHRDIKPANLMLTKNGLVKIVDFGIAKLLGVTGPTQTGTTLGTVSYMSPQQVAGEDADQQSDVWSLAAEGLEFVREGQLLSWEEATAAFIDSTGQPGPSTWELGDYPNGQGKYPVTGVSWYEAAAYARFRGKSLPTLYHWARAATSWDTIGALVPPSNFGGAGPAAVGTHAGMGPFGTYDTVGNVREWVWNLSDTHRWTLRGA